MARAKPKFFHGFLSRMSHADNHYEHLPCGETGLEMHFDTKQIVFDTYVHKGYRTQRIYTNRANETECPVSRNIAGQSLLLGNVY